MELDDEQADFLEELGNLLADYPRVAEDFTVHHFDPEADRDEQPHCLAWARIPGNGWVCLRWASPASASTSEDQT